MSQHDVKDLMLDMRDRLIRIETRVEALPELQSKVEKHGREILKAQTSVKVVRWLLGVLLIALPSTAAAIFKIFKG
jgi:hypothetical protein